MATLPGKGGPEEDHLAKSFLMFGLKKGPLAWLATRLHNGRSEMGLSLVDRGNIQCHGKHA
jgi:hypothetical protein